MTPQELSAEIRRIASKIDASKNPSRKLVASDIQRVIRRLANEETMDLTNETKGAAASHAMGIGECNMTVGGKTYHGTTAEECMAAYKDACSRGEH